MNKDIRMILTLTRSRDTQLPVSRPLAMCAISWTTPPFDRISHCIILSNQVLERDPII